VALHHYYFLVSEQTADAARDVVDIAAVKTSEESSEHSEHPDSSCL
jgi:hypothetical protein